MPRRKAIFTKAELKRLAEVAAATGQPIWLKRGDTMARADPPGKSLPDPGALVDASKPIRL